jgi:peptidoglycan/LPS O-acetylase OafA/YrhL
MLFTRLTFIGAVATYAIGLTGYFYPSWYPLTDALTGIGLFVMLAHAAIWSCKLPRLASSLAFVGTYSYGLYLIHQPFVLYFGERMRDLGMPVFVVVASGIIVLLTAVSVLLERWVNQLTNRLLQRGRMQPAVATATNPGGEPRS